MSIFKKLFRCNHDWEIIEYSNCLQLDDMGYPLRLFIVKCRKCGKTDHHWIDVPVEQLSDLGTGKSVLLRWEKYNR